MPIVELRSAIVERLRERLQDVSVDELPRAEYTDALIASSLKNKHLAIRVAFVGVAEDVEWGSQEIDVPLTWSVLIFTKDVSRELPRDVVALQTIAKVMAAVADGKFEMSRPEGEPDDGNGCDGERLHAVRRLRATSLYDGEIDTKSAMVWEVSWTQTMTIPPAYSCDIRPLLELITHYDLAPGDGTHEASDTIDMRNP